MSTAIVIAQAALGGLLAVLVFLIMLGILRSLIRVCPSNQILVITGGTETLVDGRRYGFRIQRGGWTIVLPFIQSAQAIDLTILPINVKIEGVNSANGISVGADATACVCVNDQNDTLLYSAVQQLLGKSRKQIHDQIQQTMMGNFRAALNKTTPLQAIGMVESVEGVSDAELAEVLPALKKTEGAAATPGEAEEGERAIFRQVLLDDCQSDLSSFGMEVVSVSLQRIWDTSNYIANLANKTLSRKRQEVEIEEARLRARAEQAESDANRRMLVAENEANERILAKKQEVELFRRQCEAAVMQARLEADSNIAQANNAAQRQIQEMNVELQKLRNQSQITLAAEAQRRAAEITAQGEREAVEVVQSARNELLQQKVRLLQQTGDQGKIALFMMQLPKLFAAYHHHAATIKVDNMLVLNEEDGFNSAVNRGPAAMVDFMRKLDEGLGVSVKGLLSTARAAGNTPQTSETAPPPATSTTIAPGVSSGNGGKEA